MAKRASNNSRRLAIVLAANRAFLTFKVLGEWKLYLSSNFWSRNFHYCLHIFTSFSSNMVLLGCAAASNHFCAFFRWFSNRAQSVGETVFSVRRSSEKVFLVSQVADPRPLRNWFSLDSLIQVIRIHRTRVFALNKSFLGFWRSNAFQFDRSNLSIPFLSAWGSIYWSLDSPSPDYSGSIWTLQDLKAPREPPAHCLRSPLAAGSRSFLNYGKANIV